MSEVVRQESAFFLASVATGVILVWSYDMFRFFRRIVPHHMIAVSIEDIIYWLAVAFVIFGMIFEKNGGALRGYAFVGILLGTWLQFLAEAFLKKIWIKLLKKVKKRGKISNSKR